MKPFLIVFFSGVGNTKAVAESIKKHIDSTNAAEIYSAEKLTDQFPIDDYSAVILGTPTYHSEPAAKLMKFVKSLNPAHEIPAFIFTTCGLYSENCLRILAKKCLKHQIIPIHYASYRCSATDGMLLMPSLKYWYENERNLQHRIQEDCSLFIKKLHSHSKADIPRTKWYTPLNYPNKMLGKNVPFPIFLHEARCIHCGKCKRDCPQGAITATNGYPVINKAKCMNCYRCIHHCPALALSLSKKKAVEKVWRNLL